MDTDKESAFDATANPRLNTIDEYDTLMNSIGVSVSKHRLDEDFTVLWANDSYYSSTGYSKEAVSYTHLDVYKRQVQGTAAYPGLDGGGPDCDRALLRGYRGIPAAEA